MNRKNLTLILLFAVICAACAFCLVTDGRNAVICPGQDGTAAVRVRWNSYEAVIRPWYCEADGTYCYVLPSALCGDTLWNDDPEAELRIDGQAVPKYGAFRWEEGREYRMACGGGEERTVRFLATSGLPAVFIYLDSGLGPLNADKTRTEAGKIDVFAADGSVCCSGGMTMRGRGNSTFSAFDKKPFNIQLDKAAYILGMDRDRDWCLLANAWDYSYMNNKLALDMAENAGFRYVPDAEYADVWVNGEYRGLYLIAEKVEVDGGRIGITDLKEKNMQANPGTDPAAAEPFDDGNIRGVLLDNLPRDITGGYVIERDYRLRSDYPNRRTTPSGFETAEYGTAFSILSPAYADRREAEYISALAGEAEQAIRAEDGMSAAGKSWLEYIDLDSWVRSYMIAEIAYDLDKDVSNTYYYKDTDSTDPRLYAGPVWDYDNRFGGAEGYASAEVLTKLAYGGWGYDGGWSQYLYEKPEFFAAVCREWQSFFRDYLAEEAAGKIDAWREQIRKSAAADTLRWPRGKGYPRTWPGRYGEAFTDSYSFEDAAEYLKNWIGKRCAFLDGYWGENGE